MTEVMFPHIWQQIWIRWKQIWIIHTFLITDKKISNIQEILPLLGAGCTELVQNLLIIAEDVEGEALTTLGYQQTSEVHSML